MLVCSLVCPLLGGGLASGGRGGEYMARSRKEKQMQLFLLVLLQTKDTDNPGTPPSSAFHLLHSVLESSNLCEMSPGGRGEGGRAESLRQRTRGRKGGEEPLYAFFLGLRCDFILRQPAGEHRFWLKQPGLSFL